MSTPTLATGCCKRWPLPCGFTLIEVLVVLAILGVLSSLIVFTVMPNAGREAANEVSRLQLVLELAVQESQTTGRPIAWVAEGVSYRFMHADLERRWQAVTDDEYLRPRRLADGMRIGNVFVEEQPLPAGTWLVFTSTATPLFRIEIESSRALFILRARPNGRVDLVARNIS